MQRPRVTYTEGLLKQRPTERVMMYSVTQNTNLPCYLVSQGVSVTSVLERQRELLTLETTRAVLELWTKRRVLHE